MGQHQANKYSNYLEPQRRKAAKNLLEETMAENIPNAEKKPISRFRKHREFKIRNTKKPSL